jgi:delta(3,5)-delta(2,4)-dienoyl-CoA isomerase
LYIACCSGNGKIFTSGIDLSDLSSLAGIVYGEEDIARKANQLYTTIRRFQQLFSRLEACPKPVIGAVHSACVGGGVDLLAATDIRVCTRDAWFQVMVIKFQCFEAVPCR